MTLWIRWSVDDVPKLLFTLVPQAARQSSRGLVVFGAIPVGAIPARFAFPDKIGADYRRIPAPAIGLAGDRADLDHPQRRIGGERFRQHLLIAHQAVAEALLQCALRA